MAEAAAATSAAPHTGTNAKAARRVVSTAFVVTGNRLRDGRVVYLGEGRWSPILAEAASHATEGERDRALEVGRSTPNEITGVYAFDVGITASGERILSARERLRAAGEGGTLDRLGLRRRLGHGR